MTNNKRNLRRTGIITGTFLAVAVAGFASTSNNTVNTSSNLLDFDVLGSGSEIRADVSTLNGNLYRTLELKCGEGKCGEETKAKTETTKKATAKEAKAKRKAAKKAKKEKK